MGHHEILASFDLPVLKIGLERIIKRLSKKNGLPADKYGGDNRRAN